MKFLVIGNALPERVTRQETGQHRYHTGGVAAIIARELALAGNQTTMVTNGAKGRVIHHAGKSPRHAAAVKVPPGTDYIGAGDAATAGLVHAMAHELDQDETVDRFIADLLARNAAGYINGP